MTDEQIIIDGVDVSKCEHLYRGIDCLAHIDFSECCESYNPSYGYCPNTDCYYKQLKRKEQECKGLKEEVSLLKESNSKLQQIEDVNSLEKCYLQQLDQLKAEIDKKELIFAGIETSNRLLIEKNNKLKQTLTGIKEIVGIGLVDGLQPEEYSGFLKTLQAQILQKISECEAENE